MEHTKRTPSPSAWSKDNPGPGRPKGTPNKTTADIKEAILKALESKGGWRYLARQADENPVAFLGLLGKIMPLQVNGSGNVLLIEQLCVVANREWQEERKRLTQPVIEAEAVEVTPQTETAHDDGAEYGTAAANPVKAAEKAKVPQRVPLRRAKSKRSKAKRKPPTEAQLEALAAGRAKLRHSPTAASGSQKPVVTAQMLKSAHDS